VSRSSTQLQNIDSLILKAIEKKQNKGGAAYATGKMLIIFLSANGGEWFPNRVARKLPKPLDFEDIWIVGLQSVVQEKYIYNEWSGVRPAYLHYL
jgi:hypothetical protein